MSFKTRLLKLFKYDTELDKKKTFKINEALNENWDKIEANSLAVKYNENISYNKSDNDWVWDIVNGKKEIFVSLVDDNLGNPLTDTTKWEKVNLGSSSRKLCEIGLALYVDEVDNTQRRLNGQILTINTNTQAFLTKLQSIIALYPTLACTESEWQAAKTLSAFGQVGKFVLNYAADGTTVESVRLPAVVNIQGLLDLSKLGMTVEAGLPNITGEKGTLTSTGGDTSLSGGIKEGHYASTSTTTPSGLYHANLILDASKSSPIYGNSDTVQQEAVLYPYFIQIATGQETENNIVNDIELNNPYSFGKSEYSKFPKDNLSWFVSTVQYASKADYSDYYNWILTNANEEKEGFKFSTASDITDYDFVINTADEKFRLPLLDGSENLPGDNAEILTLSSSGQTFTAPKNGKYVLSVTASSTDCFVGLYNESTGEQLEDYIGNTGDYSSVSVEAKRGDTIKVSYRHATIRSFIFIPYVGNGKLYYYVGETVQNAHLINAGRFAESLADKVDITNTEWAVNACMPDYSAGIAVSGTLFTAPAKGFFIAATIGGNAGKVYVNGNFVGYTSNNGADSSSSFWVDKDDIITLRSGYSFELKNCTFYPLKGGNKND